MPVFRIRSARTALVAAFAALVYLGASAVALAQDTVTFDIPEQPLSTALSEFARQSGQQLLYTPDVTEGRTSSTVQGDFAPRDALDRLLEGTEQAFAYTPSGAVLVGDPTEIRRRAAQMDSSQAPGQNTIGQRQPGIEEIIVTGQKREERIQDVPIAISAFSPEDLEAQKIEGGFDLLKGVPNVSFTKTNFTGYNFQIRGIGTQAVSATTDPGVAVSFNNTTLIVNRLFEQEYLDVERVEVLRGPQGTLFGRNATAGVINVISNKPELGVWDGMIDVEVGNYNTRRLRGFFNAPIGDTLAIRGAYASTKRDGFGTNLAHDDPFADVSKDVDDRDLWTGRLSLGWQPTDRFRANLIWERFEEDDQRVRTSKQLCHHDPGPSQLDSADVSQLPALFRAPLSQGCRGGSLYDTGEPGLSVDDPAGAAHGAYGTPNGPSLPFIGALYFGPLLGGIFDLGHLGRNPYVPWPTRPIPDSPAPCEAKAGFPAVTPINECNPDPYRGRGQSRDLRTIFSKLEPEYRAKADIFEFSFDFDLTDNLTLSSQTVYVDDEYFATQDFNRYQSFPIFNDANNACGITFLEDLGGFPGTDCTEVGEELVISNPFGGGGLATGVTEGGRGTYPGADVLAGGVFCDPQLGCSDSLVSQDLAVSNSSQYNQEVRLVSNFAGDWNFSLGANYTRFQTRTDYFIFANALTMITNFFPYNFSTPMNETSGAEQCADPGATREFGLCVFVDPKPLDALPDDPQGHNFFLSANPYKLTSEALFGELYWNATPTVKVTLGLRYTWDQKVFTPVPSQLLLRDYRQFSAFVDEGDGPEECDEIGGACETAGNALNGRGYPKSPDIVQEWNEPTGRLVVDWQPTLGFTDETMVYASFSHGYKGGGANPPTIAPPAGTLNAQNAGVSVPPTFEPEFINAYELGTKNTLFGGALTLNGTAFYYDYTDYQVSKIVNRSAANENFDAEVWGLEFESIFAPSLNWQFNATIGFLDTEIADGEKSIDLMDRTDGGGQHHELPEGRSTTVIGPDGERITREFFDEWVVVKPWITNSTNCVLPKLVVKSIILGLENPESPTDLEALQLAQLCPGSQILPDNLTIGGAVPLGTRGRIALCDPNFPRLPNGNCSFANRYVLVYDPSSDGPNKGQGFFKDLGGNELPNSPELTVALGAQYNFDLTRDWRATARVDWYWQDESFARVYNTEIDRLKSWSSTNLSFWITNQTSGITVEGYVKNVFDETPITGTFLNGDDVGLTTNAFTLEPRLIGVSVRKEF